MATRGRSAGRSRDWLGAVGFIAPVLVLPLQDRLPAWAFMWVLAVAIFAACKWLTWWNATKHAPLRRSISYLLLWPGMNANEFLDSRVPVKRPLPGAWLNAVARTAIGAVLVWLLARRAPNALAAGWIGMFGLITFLHFGTFCLLALAWQSVGVNAGSIMREPSHARSLGEFWGRPLECRFPSLGKAVDLPSFCASFWSRRCDHGRLPDIGSPA